MGRGSDDIQLNPGYSTEMATQRETAIDSVAADRPNVVTETLSKIYDLGKAIVGGAYDLVAEYGTEAILTTARPVTSALSLLDGDPKSNKAEELLRDILTDSGDYIRQTGMGVLNGDYDFGSGTTARKVRNIERFESEPDPTMKDLRSIFSGGKKMPTSKKQTKKSQSNPKQMGSRKRNRGKTNALPAFYSPNPLIRYQ